MDDPKTRIDSWYARVKSNPVVAILLILGGIVVGLSTFTNAAKNLLTLVPAQTRPAVNGDWVAEVDYDWPGAHFAETFAFSGEGGTLNGSASFLRAPKGILDGKTSKDTVQFTTRSQEIGNPQEVLHHYRGTLAGSEIRFVMQTEGSLSAHTPVAFTARKANATN